MIFSLSAFNYYIDALKLLFPYQGWRDDSAVKRDDSAVKRTCSKIVGTRVQIPAPMSCQRVLRCLWFEVWGVGHPLCPLRLWVHMSMYSHWHTHTHKWNKMKIPYPICTSQLQVYVPLPMARISWLHKSGILGQASSFLIDGYLWV